MPASTSSIAAARHQERHPSHLAPFFKSITAPMALAQSRPQVIVQESKELKEIIARLNERLDEPFVTAGIVTGDKGVKTCASRRQTSSLDLLRRHQVYPTRRRMSTSAS
jgi:hypothetical protein